MSELDEIIGNLPMADIAAKLGVDEPTARSAVDKALPTLVAGMGANATDPAGAASLEEALAQHDPKLVQGGVNLDDVDEADGEKIVKNVFGGNTDQVVNALHTNSGGGIGAVVVKLLPILAPIVLSFLAGKFQNKQQTAGARADGGGGGGDRRHPRRTPRRRWRVWRWRVGGGGSAGGGLGDILGGLLGGGAAGGSSGSGGGLGDVLGGLLGGGKR